MDEVLGKTHINQTLSNTGSLSESLVSKITSLLPDVIEQAKKNLNIHFEEYQKKTNPQIDEEVEKLEQLRQKKMDYQQSLFSNDERFMSEAERKVNKIFDDFVNYVTETLTIKDNPYIKIVAVLTGAQ